MRSGLAPQLIDSCLAGHQVATLKGAAAKEKRKEDAYEAARREAREATAALQVAQYAYLPLHNLGSMV